MLHGSVVSKNIRDIKRFVCSIDCQDAKLGPFDIFLADGDREWKEIYVSCYPELEAKFGSKVVTSTEA